VIRPGVGYIDLSEGFSFTTSDEFHKAFSVLKRSGIKSLVIDLRGNGGGIVDQAVKVAEKFLPYGTLILTQRGRTANDNRVWRSSCTVHDPIPLVIIVNKETASASEIVAGAFQDNDRALIIGEKTFGKGLVQSVLDLPGSTGLTLTTARYLTPSGRSIQREYSTDGLYDYFNHVTPAAALGKPYFEARTVTDRRVYGGDGIKPDDIIESREITALQATLLDPIFLFSRQLVSGKVAGFEQYGLDGRSFGRRTNAEDAGIPDEMMSAFFNFVEANGKGKLAGQAVAGEKAFIKLRLQHSLVMASFGAIAANKVLIQNDPQVSRAIEALPGAGRLAALAARSRRP
jgi:carboxyl-terminal processing protease